MKKFLIIALAGTMLAAPMAQAQYRGHEPRQGYSQSHKKPVYKAPRHETRKYQTGKQRWAKGQRMNDWKRQQAVRDYGRHGLRKPSAGQQWVKVDNEYLLIGLASGIIAGIVAAR